MEGPDKNLLANMFKIFYWCNEDDDMSMQVLEYEKDGEKLYFLPVHADLKNNNLVGIFMPERKDALMLNGFIDTLKPDLDKDYASEFDDLGLNALIWSLEPTEDGAVQMKGRGLGKYQDKDAQDKIFDVISDFLNRGNIDFHSLARDGATDLKIEDEKLQVLLDNASAFYQFASRTQPDEFYKMTSPVTDKTALFTLISHEQGVPEKTALFIIFPEEEVLDKIVEEVKNTENPEDIDVDQDSIFVEIYPKEGGYMVNDIPNGSLVNLSEEERREIVTDFLNVLKDVYDYALKSKSGE